jgi:hypothetical protein
VGGCLEDRFGRNCRAALPPTACGVCEVRGPFITLRGRDPRIHAAAPAWTHAVQRFASARGWPGRGPAKVGERARRSYATRVRRNFLAALSLAPRGVHEVRGPFITLRGRDRVSTRGRQHGPTQCSGLHRRVGGRVEARPRWGKGRVVPMRLVSGGIFWLHYPWPPVGFTKFAGHSSPCAGVTAYPRGGASMDPRSAAVCIGAWVAGSRPGQGGDRGRRSYATRFRRNCLAALSPAACGVHETRGPFITLRGRDPRIHAGAPAWTHAVQRLASARGWPGRGLAKVG